MDLKKVCFIDENNGFAVGGLGTRIMKTDNGGDSWSLIKIANNDQLNGIWFNDSGTGFIVGGRSKILKTEDNGRTWTPENGSNTDLMVFTAHGDDSPIQHGFLMSYLSKIENKDIAVIHVTRDTHSNEYKGEYYDYECNRSHYLMGVKTTMHFDEFDTGNNGCRSFHVNLRLWKGYDEIVRHMVAAIRAYRPDVILTHDPIFGEYDKPGHKVSGRAGFMAFYASGEPDQFPELTRLGLKPYQAKKLYTYATEAFPATYKYDFMLDVLLEGHGETVHEWANRSLRCFQSQGVHFVRHTPLHLVKSYVTVPEEEKSIFDGLE
ncbi:Mycothiol S-conjugate amidase [subsurface metagenome]